MPALSAHSVVQPAVAVRERNAAVGRMADLFACVPTDRQITIEIARDHGTLYAFDNRTYLEILDPVGPGHTRHRFIEKNGPGFYMISVDLLNDDPDEVAQEIKRLGKRVVAGGPGRGNVRHSFHIHPADAAGLLMLLAVKRDRMDNRMWAGATHYEDIPHNTRFIREVAGVIARCADPQAEARGFADMGFVMQPIEHEGRATGAWGWRGQTGNVLELWPADAWEGPAVTSRRDYAVVLRVHDIDRLRQRTAPWELHFHASRTGRLISNPDAVLGSRFALEPAFAFDPALEQT